MPLKNVSWSLSWRVLLLVLTAAWLPAQAQAQLAEPATSLAPKQPQPGVDYTVIAPRPIVNLVTALATEFKVAPQLALAIMAAESNFNPLARSRGNAQGLMQLAPDTRRRLKVKNAFDPAQNIQAGLTHLRWLLAYFEGDVALVAAAYKAGTGKVARYQGVPPSAQTQAYVQRILKAVGTTKLPFDASVTRASDVLKPSNQTERKN
jgi:soluble lytic murein transglycosylase-like protein